MKGEWELLIRTHKREKMETRLHWEKAYRDKGEVVVKAAGPEGRAFRFLKKNRSRWSNTAHETKV